MIDAFKILTRLPENYLELSDQIKYCVVDTNLGILKIIGGVYHFPTEQDLRLYRLGKDNVIWLEELAEDNCKKCNGTGNLGVIKRQVATPKSEIEKYLMKYLGKDDKKLAIAILQIMGHSPELVPNMEALLELATDELEKVEKEGRIIMMNNNELKKLAGETISKHINEETERIMRKRVVSKYATMIKKDFTISEISWCTKCFRKNFTRKVNEVLIKLQYSKGVIN